MERGPRRSDLRHAALAGLRRRRRRTKGGHFKEDFKYTAKDIRFTTKGGTLYAIALGWPDDNTLVVKSLAAGAGKITDVSSARIRRPSSTGNKPPTGLVVSLPAEKVSPYTCGLRIHGEHLKPVPVAEAALIIEPEAKGGFRLDANDAELHGAAIKVESRGVHTNIGYWEKATDWASWNVHFDQPGTYQVHLDLSTLGGAVYVVEIGDQALAGKARPTGNWDKFQSSTAGRIEITAPGVRAVKVRARMPRVGKPSTSAPSA